MPPRNRPFPPETRTAKTGSAYWIYGIHPVTLALQNPRRNILRLVATANGAAPVEAFAKARNTRLETLDPKALDNLLPAEATHQGVAAQVQPLPEASLHELLDGANGRTLVLLDQVSDPHNVGAVLRSAAAFDAAAVIQTEHHAPRENGTIAKAASGALELVPLISVTNLSQAMALIKKAGYWCIGLDGEASKTLADHKLGKNTALVLGAEGKGLRRLTAEHCDLMARLPISPQIESLNVSNAAAVALYELHRA